MARHKITFELSKEAAIRAAINAGYDKNDKDIELVAMGIQRRSRIKQSVSAGGREELLRNNQNAGYRVLNIEVA